MGIEKDDVILAISIQRNNALNETAHLYAALQAANRKVAELEAKVAELTKDSPTEQ